MVDSIGEVVDGVRDVTARSMARGASSRRSVMAGIARRSSA
jgi:hypothetical protein